jgi:MFS family permease
LGGFVLPFLVLYLTAERGFSVAEAGLAVALYGAGGILAVLLGGTLSDRMGRRRTLLFSLLVGPIFMLALAFAKQTEVILTLTFFVGSVYEVYRPATHAAISDVVPVVDRTRAFTLYYWVINLGFAIGVSLAGLLAAEGYIWLFVIDAATTFAYGLVVYFKVPETKPPEVEQRHWLIHVATPFRDAVYAPFVVITLGLACVFSLCTSMLPLEMTRDGLSPNDYGRLIALNGVMIVCFQPLIAKQLARFDRSQVMACAALVLGAGYGVTGFVDSKSGYALSIAIWTLAEMAWLPVGPTVTSSLAPAALRGTYQGAYNLSWAIAAAVGPSLGGLVLDRFGSVLLWSSCIGIGAICALGFLLLGPAIRRATAERQGV